MQNLLEINNLMVSYKTCSNLFCKQQVFNAVNDVSIAIPKGETLGLVGESGSGKSTVAKAIVRLVKVNSGSIKFGNECISCLSNREFFKYRKKIQMVFQDPYNSLDPRMRVGDIIMEPLDIHFKQLTKYDKIRRAIRLLNQVDLKKNLLERYPHELSGGQRQRIGIARALAIEPELLICDEPVSALDVSVQAQIINLLMDLQKNFGFTYLFIAHDLAVVEHVSDIVAVMKNGKIVEKATSEVLYKNPKHEYTKMLLQSIPAV